MASFSVRRPVAAGRSFQYGGRRPGSPNGGTVTSGLLGLPIIRLADHLACRSSGLRLPPDILAGDGGRLDDRVAGRAGGELQPPHRTAGDPGDEMLAVDVQPDGRP